MTEDKIRKIVHTLMYSNQSTDAVVDAVVNFVQTREDLENVLRSSEKLEIARRAAQERCRHPLTRTEMSHPAPYPDATYDICEVCGKTVKSTPLTYGH